MALSVELEVERHISKCVKYGSIRIFTYTPKYKVYEVKKFVENQVNIISRDIGEISRYHPAIKIYLKIQYSNCEDGNQHKVISSVHSKFILINGENAIADSINTLSLEVCQRFFEEETQKTCISATVIDNLSVHIFDTSDYIDLYTGKRRGTRFRNDAARERSRGIPIFQNNYCV